MSPHTGPLYLCSPPPPPEALDRSQLTAKLCFLLLVCGSLRPSDLSRIDASQTLEEPERIRLTICGPKKKRGGQCIDKMVSITVHNNPWLCPLHTYYLYRDMVGPGTCSMPRPVKQDRRIEPLLRSITFPMSGLGSERISNYIKQILRLLSPQRPRGHPKGPSSNPDLAIRSSVSLNDVLAQGSWAHASTLDMD
ncbi:MAG: hypothetical protein DHS80DRAFT_24007 [Piptocephalis tieghemiana]|nr:MAG: hypothetical protein DHS80DRAFT_24007 [Piptocephalis tieghemiana]